MRWRCQLTSHGDVAARELHSNWPLNALHLTRTTRLARLCDGAGPAGSASDSDDEAWLRDDLPSAGRLPATSALPASPPPPAPHPHPISALSGVHEAEALHEYG